MKRLPATTKYFLLFSFLFFYFFLMLIIFKAEFHIYVVSISALTVFYFFSYLFIRNEILKTLHLQNEIIEKITSFDGYEQNDNFEEKIRILNEIKRKIDYNYDFDSNSDSMKISKNLVLIIDRLINELNTAKVFKIDHNEFLGNVAHELRTPIFAIQLSLETLLDGGINDEEVNIDFLKRALRQTERLNVLVDDLRSISKLEVGMKVSKSYFVINDLIKDIIKDFSKQASNKNISMHQETSIDNNTMVFGDTDRIKQVLVNLIDNSIKYTPEGGGIILTTSLNGNNIKVRIEDNGIGIPQKDIPKIFERFYRVDKNRSRDLGGSGLGLSIVKHILELHNSEIFVESEEGKGTVFEFNLTK
jgi:two-component system, OmpR family, phosphate regulon sensor histidine kinase PhoR